jgi:hypothetical protein
MIRSLTVIGHGTNLLPHFIEHYTNYVDEIQLVVYETNAFPELGKEVYEITEKHPNVKIAKVVKDRIFDWQKVTTLYNMYKSKHPKDWWIIADIDEFHLYPYNNLQNVISDCDLNGWEIVRGGFIDRIGPSGNFPLIEPDDSIWEQFPHAGFFRYPMSKACPNKICIVKGDVEITSGQHYAKIDGQTTWKWQGWNHPLIAPFHDYSIQVHHFKWDSTCIDRIKEVAQIKQEYAYSNEYELMFKSLFKSKFKIDLNDDEYMFELGLTQPDYNQYKNWKNLFNKIVSI